MRYFILLFTAAYVALGQADMAKPKKLSAADLSTDQLISNPGPTFKVPETELPNPLTIITYGDQRFTDPANVKATDPRIRKWLVEQIAIEKPGAIVLNGDVPLAGDVKNDYAVYAKETEPWREAKLHVYPALGNHEFHNDPNESLENWWTAFPEMRSRRWYSAQLGSRAYIIAVDSDTSLLPGSNQAKWLDQQFADLPASIQLVVLTMHHPPVADIQTRIEVDHNPRPNEIALRDFLSEASKHTNAKIVVTAGHIHNYERHIVDNVTYLVSGGGGARPYFVERTPDDLYQSSLFPNYNYVKLTLNGGTVHGDMYRVVDPEGANLQVAIKDSFDLPSNTR